ncbi:MAG: hypothetical protein DRN35_04595 [Thermoplasmata archaeon]|nr:MAG: hypothetical protein DRN28_05685 [Thermoplasmata archaeon]HDD60329.1 carbon-nitrogen hydrolase family protein [Euryarchaeota archaeon]RLF70219.1 MAG: hypothetical protein DRN40_05065 [Thermoplasmata archaeon]RLF70247.1 MAG: hypothetical protein DRN35_04595 [Thermoplasmata archaeon]RLF72929.1 MAG: hypothetical protein DRN55_05065 [Thermoplasmata archaeon]
MMKAVMVQLRSKALDVKENAHMVLEALDGEGDLFIFPELFLTGYTIGRDVYSVALDETSEVVEELKEEARRKKKGIVVGAPVKSSTVRGHVHNSALIFTPSGEVGRYDKINLVNFGPFDEMHFFTPGGDLTTFTVGKFTFGVIICYDLFFPHLTQAYALSGADAVICISASPSMTRPFFEAVLPARAIENTVYMLYSNVVGPDGRQEFWGGAQGYTPRGALIKRGKYFEEDRVEVELKPEEVEIARRYRPTLRNTPLQLKRYLIDELYPIRSL